MSVLPNRAPSSTTVFNAAMIAAFAAGLLAIAWVGWGFAGSNPLALAMTVLIAAVYLMGAYEVLQFRRTTAALAGALNEAQPGLQDIAAWLERVPATLRNTVRMRIEGERAVLPGLALTPYLVGLLVMLGMLGTFLGMVVTFKGAVFALEGSTDLQAIRSALAEPIKGLALSFGTSVAGVASSAMLGLLSALARRERLDAARLLDGRMATVFRPHSFPHQRQETYQALQRQAEALPAVASQLQALMDGLDRRSAALDLQLVAQQARFHAEATQAYTTLAATVAGTLEKNLAAGAQAAREHLQQGMATAVAGITQAADRQHERLFAATQDQLDGVAQRFGRTAQGVSDAWGAALAGQASSAGAQLDRLDATLGGFTQTFEQRSASLLATVQDNARQTLDTAARDIAAGAHDHAARLQQEMSRLMETAADAPRAAAAVITQLREEMSRLTERDTRAMEERAELLSQVNTLVQGLGQAAQDQRAAVEGLAQSAQAVLQEAGERFEALLKTQAGEASASAAQVAAGAIDVASLGEAFHHGTVLFSAASEKLSDSLQRVEAAVQQSAARSDEQLAYYVAQAREVIDLSIASQQGIVEDLRRLRQAPANTGTAAIASGSKA